MTKKKSRKQRQQQFLKSTGCHGKIRHDTKQEAETHMDVLKLSGEGKLHVYACPFCMKDGKKGWHVGHYRKQAGKGRS